MEYKEKKNLQQDEENVCESETAEAVDTETQADEMAENIEAEAAEETEDDKAQKSGKSFFNKNKKEKKDKKDQQIEDLNDRLIRSIAEFDNFRKRTEKEKSQMFEIGAKDIVERILPVIDNFERGLHGVSEDEKSSAFVQGIEKVYKQLLTVLEEAGVKTIDAVGQEFDPNLHNAVMHEENEDYGENIVSEEFLKGYMYRESVVRHSMVKVVN